MDLSLSSATVELAAVTVMGEVEPLTSRARTGAASYFTDSTLARAPVLSRNFIDLVGNVPGAVGTSIAGQNFRYNNILIDGGVNNDLFALSSSGGLSGGAVNARPISIEAVKEVQVLIAPFDVRQGGFTGGLVNAVTRSGTNRFHGSFFFYGQNQSFGRSVLSRGPYTIDSVTGKAKCTIQCPDTLLTFHEYQYVGTLSGPISRDQLQFFAALDFKARVTPFVQYLSGTPATDSANFGIKSTTVDSVQAWANANLRTDPGSYTKVNNNQPDHNVFLKLNGQIADGSQLELTYNSVAASSHSLIRASTWSCCRDGFELSNAGYSQRNTTDTWRMRWNASFLGRYTNELLFGYTAIRDNRPPGMLSTLIFVNGDAPATAGFPDGAHAVSIGSERFSQNNKLYQDVVEVSDNLTFGFGQHLITVGTHNEFFKFHNEFGGSASGPYGVWAFDNYDSLAALHPYHYEISLPLRPGGPTANFDVRQLGAYVQDVWSVTPKLSLTVGMRIDAPIVRTPPDYNAKLDSVKFAHLTGDTANANTGAFSTAPLWSPRLGFNYDMNGDQSTLIRGGVGVFSGRPTYVWVSNAFANSGLTSATLACGPTNPADTTAAARAARLLVPTFVPTLGTLNAGYPTDQPTACAGGAGASTPKASIVYFDHNFKFPQTFRAALGADQRMPWGMVGTVDLLYTRTLNQFYLNDQNLKGVVGHSAGEANRPLYVTISASGSASPTRVNTTAFNDVIRQYNKDGDYSYSFTAQLNKRFSDGVEFNAGYTYSRTYDRMCLTSDISFSNFRFAVLQGALDNRPLATSCFDIPHTVKLTGSVDAPLGIRASLIYAGQSGRPFTYTVNNDVNGDGLAGNDPIYVPLYQTDILLKNASDWATIDAFINNDPCLKNARGTLMARNTCRNPWQNFLNARLSKTLPTTSGQALDISLDVFNLPNLLSEKWGVVHSTTGNENFPILQQVGYSSVIGKGTYTLLNMTARNVVQTSTRWRMLLSARYSF